MPDKEQLLHLTGPSGIQKSRFNVVKDFEHNFVVNVARIKRTSVWSKNVTITDKNETKKFQGSQSFLLPVFVFSRRDKRFNVEIGKLPPNICN